MLAVTGFRTSIVRELAKLIDGHVARISADLSKLDATFDIPPGADHFLLAAGVLWQRTTIEQTPGEIAYSLAVNLVNVVRLCDTILSSNPNARIVVIGSESATKGSFDHTYAVAKAGVHAYCRWREVLPTQLLVCLAPPIISDSGMTKKRHDYPAVLFQRKHVTAAQVAKSVRSLLYDAPAGMHGVANLC